MNSLIVKLSVILPDGVQEFQVEVPNVYSRMSKGMLSTDKVVSIMASGLTKLLGAGVKVTKPNLKGVSTPKVQVKSSNSKPKQKFGLSTSDTVFD